MHSNDIAVLNTKVVAYDPVEAGTSVVKVVIGQNDQHGVLALLALHQHSITPEELKGFHGIVGERNHGVVIVHGIGHTVDGAVSLWMGVPGTRVVQSGILHQRVGLLLFLQNGSGCIELLLDG